MAERPEDENWDTIAPVTKERQAQARANLRKRFPEMGDEDFDALSQEKTKTSKFEIFTQRLMEKYKWSRGACQQQLGLGEDDIRDC